MPHFLRPLGPAMISIMTLATASCSQAPARDEPETVDTVQVISEQSEIAIRPTDQTLDQAKPELIRSLAAAPEGLSLLSPEGDAVFNAVYGPDDCVYLGEGSEGPDLPFDRYCVWPHRPDGDVRYEILTGIVDHRIVSVALIGHPDALPRWDCTQASNAPNTELCVTTGTAPAEAAKWNTAWNDFVKVFMASP